MIRHSMRKIRQSPAFPDGTVRVRTHPLTYLHDVTSAEHAHAWHQLTYAVSGHLEVETADARALVPPDRAVWIPAGLAHGETMRAPVSVRTLYIAPGAMPAQPSTSRTLSISPLLREMIVHVSRLGALDWADPAQGRLGRVLVDLACAAPEVPLLLPTPRDPRARRLAAIIAASPGDRASLSALAGRAGGGLRTLERCFLTDTGLPVGEWRRRYRLFHALRLLEGGASVTSVAFEVGYASVSAFGEAFRRHFGVPPGRRARS